VGSQAEYDISAYGSVKVMSCNYLRNLFQDTDTYWYWLRTFTVFGDGEANDAVIPKVINSLLREKAINLTTCEENYCFIYIDEFVDCVLNVIKSNNNESGIYDVYGHPSIRLSDMLIKIVDLMGLNRDLLCFGALQERPRKKMVDEFKDTEFWEEFSNPPALENLDEAILKTIKYHKEIYDGI
jgi:nucleoside-diphosphate-sugar epimerase